MNTLSEFFPATRGRYLVQAQDADGLFQGYTDDPAKAEELLSRHFRASRWAASFATASIYDLRSFRYLWSWHAQTAQRAVDPRHPLEVIFTKALKSGRDVVLIG